MSYARRMTRPDSTQNEIVSALRKAGITVWVIGQPCDLLTYWPVMKRWRPIECKPLKERVRYDQDEQKEFLTTFAVPVVRTAEEAIAAITRS